MAIQHPLDAFLGQEGKVSTRIISFSRTRMGKVESSAPPAVIPKPNPEHSRRSEDTDPFFMVRRRR